MESVVLALDQGTTNTKAVLVNAAGTVVARGEAPLPVHHPQPGWVEQDAEDIWQSVRTAAAACLRGRREKIRAIGIANQRESFLAWNARDGRALAPCITWQCRRSSEFCAGLRRAGMAPKIREKTGLPLDPLFSAGKAQWLTAHTSCAPEELRLGTIDSWLLWKLTDGQRHACDESNAARTQLCDIRNGRWDQELCELFQTPHRALPEILPSAGDFGTVSNAAPFPDGVRVCAMLGDSHAALLGHGIVAPGAVKATYGTGSSLMTLLPAFQDARTGVATTIAWRIGETRRYAFEGNISVCASALPWAARWLGLDADPAALAKLAATVEDSAGVFFVPALVGLGAPHWNDRARGLLCGLTFNSGPPQLARAVMESIVFQVCDLFEAMAEPSTARLSALCADGGPSANRWLMQLQADLLGSPVVRREMPDASALGAAGAAGVAAGLWRDLDEFAALPRPGEEITPIMSAERRRTLRAGWHEAVARTLFATEAPA